MPAYNTDSSIAYASDSILLVMQKGFWEIAAKNTGKKNRQVTYIAPLNHIPLLSSDPGGVLQELAV